MSARDDEVDFRRVFERLPVALVVLDPDLTVLEASAAYLRTTGVSRDHIVGRSLLEAFPDDPDDPAASGTRNLRASFEWVREHRTTDVMPIQRYDVARPGGEFEPRYWAPVNAPVPAPDGGLAWIIHRVDDVTAFVQDRVGDATQADLAAGLRRQADRMDAEVFSRHRLEEQNQTLQAVLDSLDTAVVGCDRDGRAVLTNRSARELFRLPADGDMSYGWSQRFTGFDFADEQGDPLPAADLPTARLLRGATDVQDVLVIARVAGSPDRAFRVHGQPVAGGGRVAIVVAVHEVTAEQRAKRLRRCESLVSGMLGGSGPADDLLANAVELIGNRLGWVATEFWSVDQVGQVLRRQASWSATGLRNPGGLPDPLGKGVGVPGRAWLTNEPIWATNLRHDHPTRRVGERQPPVAALAVPMPSGAVVLGVLVCYSDHPDTPDDMRTAVLTGIAAHIGEFLERRRAEQYAVELDRSQDEYIALVGHELRTPLTSIQAYTDELRTDPHLSPADRAAMLEVIHRNTRSLHALIAKLLDVAGTRAGHVELRTRRMDLAAVAHASADRARADGLGPRIEVNSEPSAIIDGDPDRLREVVDELLQNATTWAPAGSTIGITVRSDDHTTVLSVSNTGVAIPVADHDRVFELFYRTGDAVRRGLPGHGLGLALARAVVEQHGGTVTVSEPDEAATTFTLRLPTRRP